MSELKRITIIGSSVVLFSDVIFQRDDNDGNERIERNLPGTLEKYKDYDKFLKEASNKWNCDFVEVGDLDSSDHFPDGVHYSIKGHKIITDRIFNFMNEKQQDNG